MDIKTLAELASKAMKETNPQQRYVALTNLGKELSGDIGNIIEACNELIKSRDINSDKPIRYTGFIEYYNKHEGHFSNIEDSICLLMEYLDDVKDFESSPSCTWAEWEKQIKQRNQLVKSPSKPKKYTPDESRHIACVCNKERRKRDDYREKKFGRYMWHRELKDYFFYRLCREIVRVDDSIKATKLRELLQKTFLYISLNNEKAMAKKELSLFGKSVMNLQLKDDKFLFTDRANKYFEKAIEKGFIEKNKDKYRWKYDNGSLVSLACFLNKVYIKDECSKTPYKRLEELFGVKYLAQTTYNALSSKEQKWKPTIDSFFEE